MKYLILAEFVVIAFIFYLSYKGLNRRSTWKDVWDVLRGLK